MRIHQRGATVHLNELAGDPTRLGRANQRHGIMAVVSAEERSAAAGITGVARTTGTAISPLFVGFMFARPSLINAPFFIAGTLKIIYDLLLYKGFVGVRPPEESS